MIDLINSEISPKRCCCVGFPIGLVIFGGSLVWWKALEKHVAQHLLCSVLREDAIYAIYAFEALINVREL